MQTPGTKKHGPLFAELHAHLNCQNDVGRMGRDMILTLELICEGQEDSLTTLECMKFEEKPSSVSLEL